LSRRFLEIGPQLKAVSKGRPAPRISAEWDLLDVEKRPGIDIVGSWGKWSGRGATVKALPVENGTYEHVYASHVLEHVWWWLTVPALRDVHRILKPGGKCEMWVPDGDLILEGWVNRKMMDGWTKHNRERNPMKWVNGRLFTYGPGVDNWHRAIFDAQYLADCFVEAGFVNVHPADEPTGPDNHKRINMGCVGFKP
jgi:SAM-dependent methyltransferase